MNSAFRTPLALVPHRGILLDSPRPLGLRHGRRWRDRSGIALTTVANEQESGSGAPQQGIDPPEERQILTCKQRKDAAASECVDHAMERA